VRLEEPGIDQLFYISTAIQHGQSQMSVNAPWPSLAMLHVDSIVGKSFHSSIQNPSINSFNVIGFRTALEKPSLNEIHVRPSFLSCAFTACSFAAPPAD
jgi:hypothetical protein